MKILIITAMYPTAENPAFGSFVRTQVEALRDAGVAVELLVLAGQPRKLIYPKGIWQLHQRLAADPTIDLVHAHFSYVGMVARSQWRRPMVVTYHGDDLLGTVINERGQHSRFSECMVVAGQWLARTIDASIVQSREMAAKLVEAHHVHIVPHEVDFELFRPIERAAARQALHFGINKRYVLFAANPQTQVKNFPFAQQVMRVINQQDPNVELVVVYKEPQERLALYMNACDALLFPSFQEGSPNIVKQAMACNLPIVASPVGDVPEVIGQTPGCAVCPLDVDQFVTHLLAILQRNQRTQGCEQIRHFDRSVVTQRLIQIYRETLQQSQRTNKIDSLQKS